MHFPTERHDKFLTSMPNLAIRIEGNTDERAEYHLALGQKRAEAVRKVLEIYGVKGSQLEAVSWAPSAQRLKGTTRPRGHRTGVRT